MNDRIGEQLGNYRLLRLLGKGGQASVYLGEHIYLKSQAALKVRHMVLTEEERTVFLQEAQTLVRLTHPHIVRVLDFALQDGMPFLVMEYAPGGTLRQRHPKGSQLPLAQALPYVHQMASALQYTHDQGLIHRDVKPENMLLNSQDQVLLSDFGLVLLAPQLLPSNATEPMEQSPPGTAPYLAPEQLRGKAQPASDQYALAVVVYEWLCGRLPFQGPFLEVALQHVSAPPPSLREQVPDLSPAIEAVVLRALAKEPELRFPCVQDFATVLAHASQEAGSSHLTPMLVSEQKPSMLNNLPLQLTSFVGRQQELAEVSRLVATTRLLTLIGAGGIGKTRLALQVAAEVLDRFSDGVWLVEFAPLADPLLVAQAVTSALGMREEAERSVLATLADYLQSRQALLVFDNCEHLVAACAALAESLLRTCARLHIIVTSREALRLGGEMVWRVPSLSLPDPRQLPAFDRVTQFEAIQLFSERAATVEPGFTLTHQNAHAVAQVCHHLDGIPLAVELAAGRMNMFSVAQIAARLDERFRLLTVGSRTALPRQQTLRATVDWSYALLSEREQVLLQRLSVFAGNWTLEAMEAICAEETAQGGGEGGAGADVLGVLTQLVNKSLVIAEEQDEEVRYRLLETIRHYAHEKLVDAGQVEEMCRRHWEWYLRLAEEAAPKLRGMEQGVWLNRLETEHDNLRAALGRLLSAGEGEIAARLAGALWQFWATHSHFSEGRHWLDAILANRRSLSTSAQSKVLLVAGELARWQGDYERARVLHAQGLTLHRTLGDNQGIAESLNYLGWVAVYQGDQEQAAKLCEESLALYRELGNKQGVASSLLGLSVVAQFRREYKRAAALCEESVTLRRELQDQSFLIYSLVNLTMATTLQGDYERAMQACREALAVSQALGHKNGLAFSLEAMAGIAGAQGQAERAAKLFGAGQALQDAIGTPLAPGLRVLYERVMMTTRDRLGEVAYAEIWAQGRAMPLQQAIAEAEQTSLSRQATSTRSAPIYPAGLSIREVEVLRLVAVGLTDAQIAERLVLSTRTVSTHLRSIYNKLGVNSRSAATRFTVEQHLI
jgi:non-specific serine/threonine protein kinase